MVLLLALEGVEAVPLSASLIAVFFTLLSIAGLRFSLEPLGYAFSSILGFLLNDEILVLSGAVFLYLCLILRGFARLIADSAAKAAVILVDYVYVAAVLFLANAIALRFSNIIELPELPDWFPLYTYLMASLTLLLMVSVGGKAFPDITLFLEKISLTKRSFMPLGNPLSVLRFVVRSTMFITAMLSIPYTPVLLLGYVAGRVAEKLVRAYAPKWIRRNIYVVTYLSMLASTLFDPRVFQIGVSEEHFLEFVRRMVS